MIDPLAMQHHVVMASPCTCLTEWNGLAPQPSAKGEGLCMQEEQTADCFQCVVVKWESIMEKSWKDWHEGKVSWY